MYSDRWRCISSSLFDRLINLTSLFQIHAAIPTAKHYKSASSKDSINRFSILLSNITFLQGSSPHIQTLKALHSCLNFRAVPWIFLCVWANNTPPAWNTQAVLLIRSLISLFQKEVACSSEYKWRVSAYCRKPADVSAASVLSEGNGNNGKKPLMCRANPATESPLLSHLNRVFASRADRLYLLMMMMRRASLPFLSRFHSRSELRTDARSWRLRFLSSPEIHAIAPYPLWRHARHGNTTHLRFDEENILWKKFWTLPNN